MSLGSTILGLALLSAPVGLEPTIAIEFAPTPDAFPRSWSRPGVDVRAEALDGDETLRSRALVLRAIAEYPRPVIERNLRRVFVFRTLQCYGLAFGGTNSSDTVYLTNQGLEQGYTERYILGSFHHEFSSILLRNYPRHFEGAGWRAANPPGFSYGDGGAAALLSGQASTVRERRFMAMGFLCEYATASLEEDVNTLAEAAFVCGPELLPILAEFPRLRRKAAILGRFYLSVDPGFRAGIFGRLAGLEPPTAAPTPP